MKKHFRTLALAMLASIGAGEAYAQSLGYPPMHGGGRPYAAQMVPGYPGGAPPMVPPHMMYAGAPAAYQNGAPAPIPHAAPAPIPSSATACSDGSCDSCGPGICEDYCSPKLRHRIGAFGEFLYLRPRDAEVVYGVPIDGPITGPDNGVQTGPTGILDPDYSAGYRVGVSVALDDCTSLVLSYTDFESSTSDSLSVTDALIPSLNTVIRSTLVHPQTVTAGAGSQFISANGEYGVDFQLIDLDYRGLLFGGPNGELSYIVGARYGKLEQNLLAEYVSVGTTQVATDIDFEGVGLKLGLDGERHHRSGLLAYGRTNVSFLAGETDASYTQSDTFGGPVVATDWSAGRVVTIMDLELGLGWQSCNGRFRVTGGYLFSGWFNAIQTDEFIDSVQTNNWTNLDGATGNSMSFDGFTTRVELRY